MEMSDLPEPIQRILKNVHLVEVHTEGCGCPAEEKPPMIQVGTLKPEDITRTIAMRARSAELSGESKVLIAKLDAIKAQLLAVHSEYWEHIIKTYSLPRGGTYEVKKDDNRILMRPEPKKP